MFSEREKLHCRETGEVCRYAGRRRVERDHLFEHLGLLLELNKNTLAQISAHGITHSDWEGLAADGLLQIGDRDGAPVASWTPRGEQIFKATIRRHRLAERLLADVLGMPLDRDEKTEGEACTLEHSIEDEVADSICTLLGHPRFCPHGYPIPPGECCARKDAAVTPFWIPLTRARRGETYVIHTVLETDAAERLIRMGVATGSRIAVRQMKPTIVIDCEQTTLALDADLAQHVLVRKAKALLS